MAYQLPTAPVKKGKGVTQFQIGIITDLDKLSKDTDADGHTFWKSLMMTGTLTYDEINKNVAIDMDNEEQARTIVSEYSRGGRGMELSELIIFNDRLYSVDDRTGIIFDVTEKGKSFPWVLLSNGDGKQARGFKGEWMTRKDGKLLVGGHGVEFIAKDGTFIHNHYQWIKIVGKKGGVKHVNWSENYDKLRNKVGCPRPGYLTHESCVWSTVHKEWFFLPRKVSKELYDDKADESRCGNIMLRCKEDFSDIRVTTIGELHPTRGYSTFKFIPGSNDTVIVAIKSEEIGDAQKSFIQVFTIDGEVLMNDAHLADKKYEGLEFI